MFFGYICLYWVEPMVKFFFLCWQNTHSVNLDCLRYGGIVSGVPKAEIKDSAIFFLWLPLPFYNPNSYFPSSFFQRWLWPSLLAYTSLHPSLSVIPLHTWWICGWVRIRTRCTSTSPIWRLSGHWFVSRMNFCFSTTDTKHTRRKQELIFSIPWCHPAQYTILCLKPFTRAWQMQDNLLINTSLQQLVVTN